MAKSKGKSGFKVIKRVSETPMPRERWEACERLLAKMIARSILSKYKRQHEEVVNND